MEPCPKTTSSAARPPSRTARRVGEVGLGVQVPLVLGQLLGHAERHAGGQDGHPATGSACGDSAATSACPDSWTATAALLARQQDVRALAGCRAGSGRGPAAKSAAVITLAVVPDRDDGRLVDQVGQVGAGEAGRAAGDRRQVDVGGQLLAARRARPGSARALGLGGQRDDDLPVEPAGPQQRRVERLGPVGGGHARRRPAPGRSRPSRPAAGSGSARARRWTDRPAPPRRWPMASISSMKMIDGARLRASANRSRTRDAPTPTNSSTKPEPVTEKNGTEASPATARASRVLPVPGGPTISTPRGPIAPAAAYRPRIAQEVHDLADLALDPLVAGDVGEAWSSAARRR